MPRFLHPDHPFAPRSWPFFYGWWLAALFALGTVASVPGQTAGVGVFKEPLMAVTGLSSLMLALAYGVGTALSSLALPFGGRLVDRFGCRPVVLVAPLVMAATLLAFTISNLLISALGGGFLAAMSVMTLLFLVLRFSGQGMMTLAYRTMIGRWFHHYRGSVAAAGGMVIGFALASAPATLRLLIAAMGWRHAWDVLALVCGVGMAVVGWFFVRDTPEECGLTMDGRSRSGSPKGEGPSAIEGCSQRHALGTAAFWGVALALSVHGMVFTGLTFHIDVIGREAGLEPVAAASIFIPMAVVGVLTSLAVGVAIDHCPIRYVLVVMCLLQAGGFYLLPFYGEPLGFWATVLIFGAAGGFFGPVLSAAPANLFGRRELGAIGGTITAVMVLGSALGPAFLAAIERVLGTYSLGMQISAVFPLIVLLFAWRAQPRVFEAGPHNRAQRIIVLALSGSSRPQ